MNDLMRQAYIVQILYHKTFLDVNDGFQYFTQRFHQAMNLWQNPYARTLLQEIQAFRKHLSPDQRTDLVMEEARLFLKEENPAMARAYYTQLLEEAQDDWAEAHKAEILYDLGDCHIALAEFQEAANSFHEALILERTRPNQQKIADILNALGYVSRCQGQFKQALDYYQEGLHIYKGLGEQPAYLRELADIFNNLGNVYRLLGKIDEALIYCQRGLQIREKLSITYDVSEVAIGFSHATLGYIYLYDGDEVKAEEHLKISFDIFKSKYNKKGLSACYNRFGMIHMKRGEMDDALNNFRRAFEEATHIDEEAQITSLNRQGHIHASHQQYEKARSTFELAVTLATNVHDSYQEAESRIDLARILAHMEKHELYHQQLEQATAIAEQQRYNKLLGEIEKLQGELSYQQQKYQDAFPHYAVFCHFMAEYNPIEYGEALRFLIDALLTMNDAAEVAKALEVLRNYWVIQLLDSTFPEFLKVCDNVGAVIS